MSTLFLFSNIVLISFHLQIIKSVNIIKSFIILLFYLNIRMIRVKDSKTDHTYYLIDYCYQNYYFQAVFNRNLL